MNDIPLLILAVIVSCITVFAVLRYYRDIKLIETVTSRNRGEWSERKTVLKLLKMGINPRAIFHDCYIQKTNGTYTQVDLVVATSQGLLVFEIKDYSGWIFGNFRQKYWTQILAYGREKHRFYNPIMQNDGHIQALRDNLPHNYGIPIYSIIVFYGNCTLKDVTIGSDYDFVIYPNHIKSLVNEIISQPIARFGDKYEIMNVLTQSVANGNLPEIVSSQLMTASYAGRNKPQSSYYYSPFSLRWFKRFW